MWSAIRSRLSHDARRFLAPRRPRHHPLSGSSGLSDVGCSVRDVAAVDFHSRPILPSTELQEYQMPCRRRLYLRWRSGRAGGPTGPGGSGGKPL